MRGAAPKAIQELAGHKSLKVTLRYMHLTETALRDTMRLGDRWATRMQWTPAVQFNVSFPGARPSRWMFPSNHQKRIGQAGRWLGRKPKAYFWSGTFSTRRRIRAEDETVAQVHLARVCRPYRSRRRARSPLEASQPDAALGPLPRETYRSLCV
jgi:hypothetical protein